MDEQHDIVGAAHRIRFWQQGSRCPVYEFVRGLVGTPDYDKIVALLKRTADRGMPLHNRTRALHLRAHGNLYELKSHEIRILLFRGEGRDLILAHALKKRSDRTPRRAIESALRVPDEWERQHREG